MSESNPRKKLSQQEFEKLPPIEKVDIVQNEILNSIYECINGNKVKLQELVKAQTVFNKSMLLKTKQRDEKGGTFVSTSTTKKQSE